MNQNSDSRSTSIQLRLSTVLLVTSIGDWLTFFSVLVWVESLTHSPYIAAGSIFGKAIGSAAGALALPYLRRFMRLNNLLWISQIASGLAGFALIAIWLIPSLQTALSILSTFFLQSFLSQIFSISRDTYSKDALDQNIAVASYSDHAHSQAILEKATSLSQFVGPACFLVGYLLVGMSVLPIFIALDAVTFFASAGLIRNLPRVEEHVRQFHIFGALPMLRSNLALRGIFLIRAIFMIVPINLGNYVLFSIVTQVYGRPSAWTAFIYGLVGLGKFYSNRCVVQGEKATSPDRPRIRAQTTLLVASLGYGVAVLLIVSGYWPFAVAGGLLFGVSNGLQITLSRALTRKFSSGTEISEVYALEALIAQITSIFVFAFYLVREPSPLLTTMIAASMMTIVGLLFYRVREWQQ